MKDKEKQIEQIARIMCGHDCEECAKETAEWRGVSFEKAKAVQCLIKKQAELLYNAGCRIILEDSVVLTKGAYDSISSKAKANVVNAVEIRKETAERDFNHIIKALEIKKASIITHYGVKESVGADVAIRTVKELAKQFGVDLKGEE